MKLADSIIKNAKTTDKMQKLADGNGLVLYIMPNGSKLWRYRYRYSGKENTLSMGKHDAQACENTYQTVIDLNEKIARWAIFLLHVRLIVYRYASHMP